MRSTSPACESHRALVGEPSRARDSSPSREQPVLPRRAGLAAGETPRCGDTRRSVIERNGDGFEHLDLALDAVAARRARRRRRSRAAAPYRRTRIGSARSSASTGVSSVFVIAVCTPLMPARPRATTLAAADRLVVHPRARRRRARCSSCPATRRRPGPGTACASAPRHTSATRWLTSTLPAPTATGRYGRDERARRRNDAHRPQRAAVRGDRRVGDRAERERDRAHGHGFDRVARCPAVARRCR